MPVIGCRVTEKEKENILKYAASKGLSVSMLLRDILQTISVEMTLSIESDWQVHLAETADVRISQIHYGLTNYRHLNQFLSFLCGKSKIMTCNDLSTLDDYILNIKLNDNTFTIKESKKTPFTQAVKNALDQIEDQAMSDFGKPLDDE